ncbi:uncharacterized protein LOC141588391 [Silene latifolia]|uniref:uncharacterized protein LOC141588391 n=1 Tax=Silene latifolia TaxID=37657 RepID=UPI003D772C31
MASNIGRPMFADLPTTSKAELFFPRVMIEIDLSSSLPVEISLNTPFGPSTQRVEYEWFPFYRSECSKMGHRVASTSKVQGSSQPCFLGDTPLSVTVDVVVRNSFDALSPIEEGEFLVSSTTVVVHLDNVQGSMAPLPNRASVALGSCKEKRQKPVVTSKSSECHMLGSPHKTTESGSPSLHSETHSVCNKKGKLDIPQIALKRGCSTESSLFIHCEVFHNATSHKFTLTIVYASNDAREMDVLWDQLINIKLTVDSWLILGDFNIARDVTERISKTYPNLSDIMGFNSYLLRGELENLNGTWCEFTWTNKHEDDSRVWSKLDRARPWQMCSDSPSSQLLLHNMYH